jgi:hypothetical protein
VNYLCKHLQVIHGFIWYILRDAWGLIVNEETPTGDAAVVPPGAADNNPDKPASTDENYSLEDPTADDGEDITCFLRPNELTGHCRIFRIRADDVPQRFDTVTICRYPDSLRDKAPQLKIPQWRTSVAGRPTGGQENPAHFRIKVIGKVKEVEEKDKNAKYRNKQKSRKLDSSSVSAFSSSNKNKSKDEEAQGPKQEIDTLTPVDIAFTFCSACNWIVSGSPDAGGDIRVRIVRSMGSAVKPGGAGKSSKSKSGKSKSKKSRKQPDYGHVDQVVERMMDDHSIGPHHHPAHGSKDSKDSKDASAQLTADPVPSQSSKTAGSASAGNPGKHANSNDAESGGYYDDSSDGDTSGYDSDAYQPQFHPPPGSGSGSGTGSATMHTPAGPPMVMEFSAPLSWISFSVKLPPG